MSTRRSKSGYNHLLADLLVDASTMELLPLALRAVPFGVKEARELLLRILFLLLRQAQTVLGIVQGLLLLRCI